MNRWLRVKMQGDCISVGHVRLGAADLFDEVEEYENVPCGTLVETTSDPTNIMVRERPSRGLITELTHSARRRMMVYLTTCRARYSAMVTLTLPEGLKVTDGQAVKARLDEMARFLLVEMKTDSDVAPSIFWTLEFQSNGMPHFHLLTNGWVGKGVLSHRWAQMWTLSSRSSSQRSVSQRGEEMMDKMISSATQIKALDDDLTLAGYMAKYLGKDEQKAVPIGYTGVGRFWGVYGDRRRRGADFGFLPLYSPTTGDISFNVQAFWLAFNRKMAPLATVRMIPWKMGQGVTVYRSRGVSRDVFTTIGRELLTLCSNYQQ